MENQNLKQQILGCASLLRATLGNMPSTKADEVVRGVIAILETL